MKNGSGQFSDTMKKCAIPSIWIQPDKKSCSQPPYKTEIIQQSIEEMNEPDDDWEKRNISEVFGCTGKISNSIKVNLRIPFFTNNNVTRLLL